MIRVFLADDDRAFRRVYRRLFERTEGFQFMDEAGTVADSLRMIDRARRGVPGDERRPEVDRVDPRAHERGRRLHPAA